MKKLIAFFIILFSLQLAKAQKAPKNQNVYYLKNDGKEVALKDSADYIRVIQEPDSGEINFNFLEFYPDGKRKTTGRVSAFEPRMIYEGTLMRFDKEGKRKEITTYEKGIPLGMSYEYFNNGKIHKQIEYLPFAFQPNPSPFTLLAMDSSPFNPNSKLIYLADSLGNEQVKDGNGYVKKVELIGKVEYREEGGYVDGVKHGVWKGSGTLSAASYVETYEKGKLIGGESTLDGVKYPYTTMGSPPTFKGGMSNFYQYIGRSTRYPSDAVRDRAAGTVYLSFTIERDGNVTEVKVERSVYPSIDQEARRMVMSSPKWLPGTMRGVPVRVKYSLPLKFSIPR